MSGRVMPCAGIDDIGRETSRIVFALLPGQIEKFLQFFDVGRRIVEPIFVFYRAVVEVAAIPKEIDHVNEPAIFSDFRVEAVTRIKRSGDLRGIAQAQHDFRRQLELVEDLMPYRHQPYRARILEAEIAGTHALFEKSDNLTLDPSYARIRPPHHRQREIVKSSQIVTVEEAENAIVKLDDLPPLPMTPRIVRCR